ncbi:PREDICTED: uncharacterized protein LOC109237377 [Nicotiana attenuata]|uniref:uncharacterized protein LOC109237377 n=1 Tax=Nicotiana attenuata TaxID=49451 RepID=UPI0009054439|nr:PREDICTED: uncharacterized protein LOC109237377 [Nicotiana attenuata]
MTGEAQTWLNSLPINSISTWEELVKQFLNRFYPPNKTARQINEILQFRQKPTETLQETWKRFKGMLVKCPHHGIPDQILGQRFYMGLADSLKANVDASARGAFLSKTFTECKILFDKMSQNSGWMTRDTTLTPIVHSIALDPNNTNAENIATLMTQMSLLTKKIDEMGTKQAAMGTNIKPVVQTKPATAQPQSRRITTTRPSRAPYQQQNNNMIEIRGMLQQLIGTNGKMQEKLAAHDSAIKGIETQLGQLSMALNNRSQGTLLADTNINPKE